MSDLPNGWIEIPLINFIQYLSTGVAQYRGEKEYFSTGSIQNSNYIAEGKFEFNKRPSRANRLSKIGDVFQARMKGTDKSLIINESLNDKLFSTGFIQLRPISETYNRKLLYYFIKSNVFLDQKDELATGSTQEALTDTKAKELKILVPPINEQKRIVERLDKLLSKVEESKARLEKIPIILKRFRQSVLNAAVTGELTKDWREKNKYSIKDVTIIIDEIKSRRLNQCKNDKEKSKINLIYEPYEENHFEIPNEWNFTALQKLCNSFEYGSSAKSNLKGDVAVLRMGNIQNGDIDWTSLVYSSSEKEIKKYLLTPNTVLFNRTNSSELVGKTAIYRGGREAIFAGYLIRINNFIELHPEYLNYCLNSTYAKEYCNSVKTDGVNQSNINAQKLAKFEIPFCSREEQKEIVKRVEVLFKPADEIESRYKKAKAYVDKLTQSILAKAFRGEFVPQDPNDEPASELLSKIKAKKEMLNKSTSKKKKKAGK